MTHEQFDSEKRYRVALSVAKSMLRQGLISEDDFKKIDTIFTEKYKPILAVLPPKIT